MNYLLKNLSGKKVYVISPHFDDAILSCGTLLSKLPNKSNITIVNVFTKAHEGPYTLSAKKFIKSSQEQNAVKLYHVRAEEDSKVFSYLKINNVINLGFVDSIFRRKSKSSFAGRFIPELVHQYPTYRWHIIGKLIKSDNSLKNLEKKLVKIIPQNAVVLAPFDLSGHVDHQIVHDVCESLFKKIVFYSEFPYNISKSNYGERGNLKRLEIKVDYKNKNKLISFYESQTQNLFPQGKIPTHKEVYFLNQNI